jgi:hypothetical protein
MLTNVRLHEVSPHVANIPPISQGAGTVDSGWLDMANFHVIEAMIQTGVLGASATVDAKLQQASDAAGTGVEDITGKAITQIVKATGDNKIARISLRPEEMVGALLSFKLTARFVRLRITVGTAASLVGGSVRGFIQENGRFSDLDLAGVVVQTV